MLVLIGKNWLGDDGARRRLHEPTDYVRVEIAAALRRPDVRVIPILVGGATMPTSGDLPEDLEGLTRRNAVEMTDARWRFDRDALMGRLDHVLSQTGRKPGRRAAARDASQERRPPPADERRRAKTQVRWGWGLTLGALILPILAIPAMVFGAMVIKRSDGQRAGMGVTIMVVAFLVGLLAFVFWLSASMSTTDSGY